MIYEIGYCINSNFRMEKQFNFDNFMSQSFDYIYFEIYVKLIKKSYVKFFFNNLYNH